MSRHADRANKKTQKAMRDARKKYRECLDRRKDKTKGA